jgi:hypothetical protein
VSIISTVLLMLTFSHMHCYPCHAMLLMLQPMCRMSSSYCVNRMRMVCRALDLKGGGPVKKVSAQYHRPQRRSTGSSYSDQLQQVHK